MSVDVNLRLFLPMTHAVPALSILARMLVGDSDRTVAIVVPDAGVVTLPISDRLADDARVQTLAVDVGLGGFDTLIAVVTRRKKRLKQPKLDRWGDEIRFKVVKQEDQVPVCIRLTRGHDYFELAIEDVGNNARLFELNGFRTQVGKLFEAGNGAAGLIEVMNEWYTYAEPRRLLDRPDDSAGDEIGIDELVAWLTTAS